MHHFQGTFQELMSVWLDNVHSFRNNCLNPSQLNLHPKQLTNLELTGTQFQVRHAFMLGHCGGNTNCTFPPNWNCKKIIENILWNMGIFTESQMHHNVHYILYSTL